MKCINCGKIEEVEDQLTTREAANIYDWWWYPEYIDPITGTIQPILACKFNCALAYSQKRRKKAELNEMRMVRQGR